MPFCAGDRAYLTALSAFICLLLCTAASPNTPPVLSEFPDQLVEINSSHNNVFDLWEFAEDLESEDYELTYSITSITDPGCGAAVDMVDYLDINPVTGWIGCSDVTVRVTDPEGLWDEDTFRVVSAHFYDKIAHARANPDGSWVAVFEKISTAEFPACIYIQEPDRACGIGLDLSGVTDCCPGNSVTAAGLLTTVDSERRIAAFYLAVNGSAPLPEPLCMANRLLGGNSPDAYTPAVPDGGKGLYNVGLLVRTSGRVIDNDGEHYFFVDDGSPTIDSHTVPALLVNGAELGGYFPPMGSYVTITGISGTEAVNGTDIARSIRPRDQADLKVE